MLTFIANLSQYHHWANGRHQKDAQLATGDVQVLYEAGRAGLPVVDLWEYFYETDANQLDAAAWSFCDALARNLAGRVVQGECDVIFEMRNELAYPVRYALVAATLVGRCLAAHNPDAVECFGEQSESFAWDPPDIPPDIFNAVVESIARERNLPIELLRLHDRVVDSSRASPEICELLELQFSTKAVRAANDISYLALSGGQDYSEAEALFLSLMPDEAKRWMLASSPMRSRALNLPQLDVQLLRGMPFEMSPALESIDRLPCTSLGDIGHVDSELPQILKSPTLGFVWRHFLASLKKGVFAYCQGWSLGCAYAPKAGFYGWDAWGVARCCLAGLRAAGARMISVHHSGVGYQRSCRRVKGLATSVLCWGEYDGAALRLYRDRNSKVLAVGSMRRDHADLLKMNQLRRASQIVPKSRPKIVLLTAQLGNMAMPIAKVSSHKRTLEGIVEWCEACPDWDFVIKPHPRYDYYEIYETLCQQNRISNLTIERRNARETLQDATIAVLLNVPSTIVLDCCAMRVPVWFLNETGFASFPALFEDRGVAVVSDVDTLKGEVARVLSNTLLREQMLHRQDEFLRRMIVAVGPEAVANVRVELARLAGDAQGPGAPNRELRWVFDVVEMAEIAMRGGMGAREIVNAFADLAKVAQYLAWANLPLVRSDRVGEYLLNLPTAWQFYAREGMARARIVRLINKALPVSIRPARRVYRNALRDACYLDGTLARRMGRVTWPLWSAAAMTLARASRVAS
ncbi:MAG: hypothetical protein M5U15_00845 [Kiritimatiellae bacterium]|nr:hypothetical protein [Kiritimatiellia bacterium]